MRSLHHRGHAQFRYNLGQGHNSLLSSSGLGCCRFRGGITIALPHSRAARLVLLVLVYQQLAQEQSALVRPLRAFVRYRLPELLATWEC